MKKLVVLFLFISTATLSFSQETSADTTTNDSVYTTVEKQPEFKEGKLALFNYIIDNIQYPKKARKKGIEGTIYLSFVVDVNGDIKDVKVLRGIGYGCDEEAIRVIQSMSGMWNPGSQNGTPVNVQYTMPISFRL